MDARYGTFLMAAMLAVACGTAKTAEQTTQSADDEKKALEQRVAQLERELAARPAEPAAPEVKPAEPRPEPVRSTVRARRAAPAAGARSGVPPAAKPSAAPPAEAPFPEGEPPARDAVDTDSRESESWSQTPPPILIPRGTSLSLTLETALSSAESREGDRVVARVEQAVADDGSVALPGGTFLEGRVTEVQPSGRVKGRARLAVAFDRIVVRGERYRVETTGISAEAADSQGRDAKILGGSAAAGAILGAITGGKKGAGKGILLGSAAGAGAVLLTKGEEIEIPSGSRWKVRTTSDREIQPLG
jgi:type IV secretory pathway VirB10-like protein